MNAPTFGDVIPLPPKAVDVLLELVRQAGSVVGKQALIERVWPDTFVEEANLNQMIFLLRRALDGGPECEYITTVPRRGYRFAADVRMIEIPHHIESIAVLPFENLGGEPAQDYLGDGVTEALITELAKIASLRVVSRISVLRYRGATESLAQIARALRVESVIQGSVRWSGDRIRISAQLIHAASGESLWAETYGGALSDILGVQDSVARDVAVRVRGDLDTVRMTNAADIANSGDNAGRASVVQRSVSRSVRPDAYALYLKGRYFGRQLTDTGQRRAIHYFHRSIEADPGYAAAYAGLAECFTELAYFFGMEPKKAFDEAEPAAEKAVDLDDTLAEGHAVLSLLRLLNDWDWRAADTESRRAIELAPGDAYVYWKRGVYLRYAGHDQEAVWAHRQAESLDPFSLIAIEEVGWPLYYARRFDEAADQFQKAVELESNWDQLYFGLGLTFVQQGRYREAISALRTAAEMAPGQSADPSIACVRPSAGRAPTRSPGGACAADGQPHLRAQLVSLDGVDRTQRKRASARIARGCLSEPRALFGKLESRSGVRSAPG